MAKMPREKRPILSEGARDNLVELFLYLCTVVGVLMSRYVDRLQEIMEGAGEIELSLSQFSWMRLVFALFIALIITYAIEREGDKAGKRKNLRKRIVMHVAYGTLWPTILNLLIGAQNLL